MWLLLGVFVAATGWLLMMVAVWGVLYGHGERWDDRGTANRR